MPFVLAVTMPEGGGALEVYDLGCEPWEAFLMSDNRVSGRPNADERESVSFRLPPGTMIILDSGRY